MQTKQKSTLESLRAALMHSIMDVRNGDMESTEAIAISKLANSVVDTYKTEIDAVRVADALKDRNIGYQNIMPIIADIKDK